MSLRTQSVGPRTMTRGVVRDVSGDPCPVLPMSLTSPGTSVTDHPDLFLGFERCPGGPTGPRVRIFGSPTVARVARGAVCVPVVGPREKGQ